MENALIQHQCAACSSPRHCRAYCCRRCKKLIDRIDIRAKHNKQARLEALKKSWDGTCFRCHYTGWQLDVADSKSPYYLTWEHRTPRDELDVVVTAAIINDMKADLAEDEFRSLIISLAAKFANPGFEVPVTNPIHYKR